jgi:AbrB family looped-hinge helix DNA binding protein
MHEIVKVTGRGRTTIPVEFREKLGIKEGDNLSAEVLDEGILLKRIPRLEECAGVYSRYGEVDKIKKRNRQNLRGILA